MHRLKRDSIDSFMRDYELHTLPVLNFTGKIEENLSYL